MIPQGKILEHPMQRRARRPANTEVHDRSSSRTAGTEIRIALTEENMVVLGFLSEEERTEMDTAVALIHELYARALERTAPRPSARHENYADFSIQPSTQPEPATEPEQHSDEQTEPRVNPESENHTEPEADRSQDGAETESGERAVGVQGNGTDAETPGNGVIETPVTAPAPAPAAPKGRGKGGKAAHQEPAGEPQGTETPDPTVLAAFAAAANAAGE